jgi:hypothetical protein
MINTEYEASMTYGDDPKPSLAEELSELEASYEIGVKGVERLERAIPVARDELGAAGDEVARLGQELHERQEKLRTLWRQSPDRPAAEQAYLQAWKAWKEAGDRAQELTCRLSTLEQRYDWLRGQVQACAGKIQETLQQIENGRAVVIPPPAPEPRSSLLAGLRKAIGG